VDKNGAILRQYYELLKENIFNIVGVISLIVGILAFIDGKSAKKSAKSEKTIREYLFYVAEKTLI